jgi:peptide/nickel transport system substrate-binding protein
MSRQTSRRAFATRAIVLTAILVALSTWGAVAALGGGTKATATPDTLVVNYAVPPATLDPSNACSLEDIAFLSSIYTSLVKYATKPGPGGTTQEDPTRFVPYFATSWKLSDGGRTYTFALRRGLTFPSGRPFDANAVKYTIERNLKTGSCGTYFISAGQGPGLIKSVAAPNPTTVVVRLSRPEPLFLHTMTQASTGIFDPQLIEEHGGVQPGKINQWLQGNYAGVGPYVLESYEPGRQAVFVANPDFFTPEPLRSRIVINFITSDSTLLLQARTGKADVTLGLTKKSVASLRGNDCCRIIATPAAAWQLIGLPNKLAPFNNPTFRRALSYAVPYKDILDKVAFGYGQLYYGPYPPAFPQFNAAISKPRTFSINRAKALLNQSGVEVPVNVDMVIREGVNDQEQIATIVQSTWKELGVNVTIKKLSGAEYQSAISAEKKTYSLVRFDGPSVPDPAWLLDYDMRCASIFNTSNYCSKPAEALLNRVHPIADRTARQTIWNRIARIWVNDSPRIPVYAENFTVVLKKGVNHYRYAQDDWLFYLWG